MDTQILYRVGYTSKFNPATGLHEYWYAALSQRIVLHCPQAFYRGDTVILRGIEGDRIAVAPAAGDPLAALLLVHPGIPFDAGVDCTWQADGCRVLHHWPVECRGNASVVSAVAVPLSGVAYLTGTCSKTGDSFQYCFRSDR